MASETALLRDADARARDNAPQIAEAPVSARVSESAGQAGGFTGSEWRQAYEASASRIRALQRSAESLVRPARTYRSSQLDAARLDDELGQMMKEQFMRIFSMFQPGLVAQYQPELMLVLEALIFRYTIWRNAPLPGMALMNLRYRDERRAGTAPSVQSGSDSGALELRTGVEGPGLSRRQRLLFAAGSLGVRYGWHRLSHLAAGLDGGRAEAPPSWRGSAWAAVRGAEGAFRLASLLNLAVFLRTGTYRSLLERLLRARPVFRRPAAGRAVSFEYLNRQLVWSELSEVLLFLLPLLNVDLLRRSLRTLLPGSHLLAVAGADPATSDGPGGVSGSCPACESRSAPVRVQARPCGHAFCYFCLGSELAGDADYACPVCLKPVAGMQRLVARVRQAQS